MDNNILHYQTSQLNGNFGVCIHDVSRDDLYNANFQAVAYELWVQHGGLLAIRGSALASISPEDLLSILRSNSFNSFDIEFDLSICLGIRIVIKL